MKSSQVLRTAAGVAVLLILVLVGVLLVPPYIQNWKLQRYVNELLDDPATANQAPEGVRAEVLNKAASLGLPVHSDDVHVAKSGAAMRIDALYVVHIGVGGYTVDLHFRPAAGGT